MLSSIAYKLAKNDLVTGFGVHRKHATFGPLYDPSAIKEKYLALLESLKVIETDIRREGRLWHNRRDSRLHEMAVYDLLY